MAKHKQKIFSVTNNPSSSEKLLPAISVIIPLYNAEKYIGECLDSLLAQTFKNFEVIVVDDCSTDSSPAIVESYKEKFGGRLKLSRMEKNCGSGSLPRNKGLTISRGEYIFNMDNDDLLTKTAFEEIYTLAKNFDADVVHCERCYTVKADLTDKKEFTYMKGAFVDQPTLETENLNERFKSIFGKRFGVTPWSKLVRRDILVDNGIIFPNIIRDDDIWTWSLVFYAKKILRVPNGVYVWRNVEDSITRVERTPAQKINFWLNPVMLGVKTLDEVLDKINFFKTNPQHRYALLNLFIEASFSAIINNSFKLNPFEVYATLKQKFGDKLGEHDVLIPLLCATLNTHQKIFAINQQKFQRFAAQAQKRIAELEAQLKIR